MQAKAIARTIRIAPRKVRLVLDLVRGKEVSEALAILKLTNKRTSPVVEKLIKSAVANAEHNYDMDIDSLFVSEIYADEGPTLKRFRPRAKGSASRINKRTSHISVVLEEFVYEDEEEEDVPAEETETAETETDTADTETTETETAETDSEDKSDIHTAAVTDVDTDKDEVTSEDIEQVEAQNQPAEAEVAESMTDTETTQEDEKSDKA